MPDRKVLHASGFTEDNQVRSVSVTTYVGDLEDVVPGIVAEMERLGHEVTARTLRPFNDWWLVQVDLDVIVKRDGEEISRMWHVFTYPSQPWPGAGPATTAERPQQ